ncbi:MAG: FAD-binding oxidoreductase [Holophagales bacterium]|nr:FAD-binding oxidoreductase [Holophagales bacterium]
MEGAGAAERRAADTEADSQIAAGIRSEAPASRLEGWGRHPVVYGEERLDEDLTATTAGASLTRGLGRSYGDASLPAGSRPVAGSRLADRILGFDPKTGVLRAEAGLTLHQLTWTFLPRGFASPVMPGTAHITLGGMVAADVHGKEHHRSGAFGRHVERLRLRLADGRTLWTGAEEEPELFHATLGGMGLTGHVLEVRLRLARIPSPWVYQETERVPHLGAFLEALDQAAGSWPMTMGWIDCLCQGRSMGRGIVFRGRWAEPADRPPAHSPKPKSRFAMPVEMPSFLLNRHTVGLFNQLIYGRHPRRRTRRVVHPDTFFHPLDTVRHWNRGYGRRGFTQYQCVVPGRDGVFRVLERLTHLGAASFLCVIKDCGEEGSGLLSFPKRGTSIAVDLPIRRDTARVVAELNTQVIEEGGRIYLAKDTFTTAEHFEAMEGERLEAFRAVRRQYDPEARITSLQAERLGL